MLSRLANYLLRGSASGTEDEYPPTQNNNETDNEKIASIPVDTRLRQVEVEGDEWILIDQNVPVDGFMGLDESWYVTPPACFTQPGPVHVETSPMENLLIEHPSMSVYRAAGPTACGDKSDKSKKQRSTKHSVLEGMKIAGSRTRLPLASRNVNTQDSTSDAGAAVARRSEASAPVNVIITKIQSDIDNRSAYHHQYHHRHQHHQAGAVTEQPRRKSSTRDLRNIHGDENVRIIQIRSAQKMLEKRTTQSAKRNRLEHSNKAREVSSDKARRPRRKDRFRLNNSGVNNNRKC